MVISAENPRPPPDTMAAPPARAESQSSLHNFSFPIHKKWGSQRVLRCLNVNRKGEIIRSPPPTISRSAAIRSIENHDDDDKSLEEVREKLLDPVHEAEARLNIPEAVAASFLQTPEIPPRNLRTRRTPVKDPSISPPRADGSREGKVDNVRTVRLRSEDAEKRERPKFSITLTREEIDEDIYAVTGARARRRPKKRPRNVQKQLDLLFPGSWPSEISVDSYKVPD